MAYILWSLSLFATFTLGYKLGDITKKLTVVEQILKEKVDKKPEPEEPVSNFIDPYDEVQTAIYERDKLMKKMNPDA